MEKLPKFGRVPYCVKCGEFAEGAKAFYVKEGPVYSITGTYTYIVSHQVEHINRQCGTCGYEWKEAPLDIPNEI